MLVACTAVPAAAQASSSSNALQTVFEKHYADGSAANYLQQTSDGGYVIAGAALTAGGGGYEAWFAKINTTGQEQWNHLYPYANITKESIYSLQKTQDGGFILAGNESVNGITRPWLEKVDADGVSEWANYYTSFGTALANSVQQTSGGGYVMVGNTLNAALAPTGSFIVKVDSSGVQGLNNTFNSTANMVQVTQDGGYVVVGALGAQGNAQPYVIKLDSNLDVVWQNLYPVQQGGDGFFWAVQPTSDGGYICAGATAPASSYYAALLLKIDASGNKVWENRYGGPRGELAYSVQPTSDGGYILGGETFSFGTVGVGSPWLVKTDANGNEMWNQTWADIQGVAHGVQQTSDGGYVFTGRDAVTGSPYLIKAMAEIPPLPLGGMATWVVLALVLVGIVGMGYMRRSKRGAPPTPLSESSGGGTTQTTGTDQTGPPFVGPPGPQPPGSQYITAPPVEQSAYPSFPVELGSQFSDVRYLGEGGFARVFSALDLQGTPVAVKVLKSRDPKVGKLFITEAANSSVLHHENIVRLFDYNIIPVPYLALELCDGSVERQMSSAPVTVARGIEIMKQIALGLSYAHKQKILHGDIKPSNILLKENVVKIADWGLSKLKTEKSVSIGGVTLQYAAPEELSRQFGRADERTDLYQAGVLFYQLVTGKLPFADDASLIDAILEDAPIPPSQVRSMSPKLETIILTCLRKRKEERYQSMDELLRDLDGVND
jgi:hypothetical protein